VIEVDTPGVTAVNRTINYRHIRRPMYPLQSTEY
jgi:hypothetical protein